MFKAKFTVRMTAKYGVFIDCDDRETADEFDDYLSEELDLETGRIFEENFLTFIMGDDITLEQAQKIVTDFQQRPIP